MANLIEKATNIPNVKDFIVEGQENNTKVFGERGLTENAHIELNPLVFDAYGKIMRTDNRRLATAIKEYYKNIMNDLRGVNILYMPGQQQRDSYVLEFYFSKSTDRDPNKIDNLVAINNASSVTGNNMYIKNQIMQNKAAGKAYALNDETKLLLGDIVYGGKKAMLPNNRKWDSAISEHFVPVQDPTYSRGAGEYVLRVAGCFDILRVLQKLYGDTIITKSVATTDATGHKSATNYAFEAAYKLRFIKWSQKEFGIFYMNIEQFSKEYVDKITIEENPIRPVYVGGLQYF